MSELFTFADDGRWNTPRLESRYTDLLEHQKAPYLTEVRKESITREMCHIAFEGLMRQRETNQREQEIAELTQKYETFTSQQYTGSRPKISRKIRKQQEQGGE